eukprot:scaffold132412_cov26-Tisochrysis_lutea.AAC.8
MAAPSDSRQCPLAPQSVHLRYNADPEAFVWEEASARETSSLRRCAEQTLKSLADGTSAREVRTGSCCPMVVGATRRR